MQADKQRIKRKKIQNNTTHVCLKQRTNREKLHVGTKTNTKSKFQWSREKLVNISERIE